MAPRRRRSKAVEDLFAIPPLPLLSDDQVKRHQQLLGRLAKATGFCARKECGCEIVQLSYESRQEHEARLFCSDRCARLERVARAHERRAQERAANTKVCQACNQPFERHPRESHRHFEHRRTCGRTCPNPAQAAQLRRAIRLTRRVRRDGSPT